ncbi:MraY family glycosyltransferase [Pseudomonas monteilii]|uniref:Glycosyltransferase family 4 protein n=1 Tax=Pseudomonas monteilii TaxID=76759 RepID=A0A399M3L4_9PSED|nr:glycosyltransferase family 4 protein [Pseudomonas monteilii]RII75947.1 glycosyltransferase family 4 protein [Pseudomonas monteilii]
MSQAFVVLITSLVSFLLTALVRKVSLAKSVMDIPNARSSHSIPTPRGGGVAIVTAFLAAVISVYALSGLDSNVLAGLVGAGAGVALVGFFDDLGHIAARWRLLAHFAASAWLVWMLGGMAPIQLFGQIYDLGVIGSLLAVIYLVWMLNLYNFMDGIDGLASLEAITVCLGVGLLAYLAGQSQLVFLPMALAAATAGFLCWNFPPARIFMGDAGSGFLGVVLGGLSLQAAWHYPQLLWCWLILLGVFIVDSTYTLLHRMLRGEKVYEAHRSHAYQFASRRYGSHLPVSMAVAALNLLWLLPVALCVLLFDLDGLTGVLIAYAPLVYVAVRFNAGALEK